MKFLTTKTSKDLQNVYLDGKLELVFDEKVDSSTVTDTTVQLYRKADTWQRHGINLEVDNKSINITFKSALLPNEKWIVLIISGASGVKASDGSELATNVQVEFKTTNTVTPPPDETPTVDITTQLDDVNEVHTGTDKDYIVPDTTPQGEIQEFQECPTDFSSPDGIPHGPANSTSGLPTTASGKLTINGSAPSPYEVGVTDIEDLLVIWNKDVKAGPKTPSVKLTYQELPAPDDPFASTTVIKDEDDIYVDNELNASFVPPADTVNKEFTVVIKAGRVVADDDSAKNSTEKWVFSGPLQPSFVGLEDVKVTAGMWNQEFDSKDIYYFTKLIHQESVQGMDILGYKKVEDITEKDLKRLKKFVRCIVALKMRAVGTGGSSGSGATGSELFVRKRDLPGVSITYDEFSSKGTNDETSPTQELERKLKDCICETEIVGCTDSDHKGSIIVDSGVKSMWPWDLYRPTRGRRY